MTALDDREAAVREALYREEYENAYGKTTSMFSRRPRERREPGDHGSTTARRRVLRDT